MIKQQELEDYLELEAKVEKGKNQLKLAQAKLDDWKDSILERVKSKEPQQKGQHRAKCEEYKKRANVSWKDEIINIKGKLFVEQLLAKAKRDTGYKLVIRTNSE